MESPINAGDTFGESAQRIVDYLNEHTPISDWSVSRVSGGEQVHLHVHGVELLEVGDRVDWDETFCHRMVVGGAHVVRNSLLDPTYADLKKAQEIGAYAGFPIIDGDGSRFGTLCGVNTLPLAPESAIDEALLRLFSELLSAQLAMSRSLDAGRQATVIAEAIANTDALTGIMNRRGWDLVVGDAQQRIDEFGDAVAIIVIDLDGLKRVNDHDGHRAGDLLIRDAADSLQSVARSGDRIARYGGDEFAVLVNNLAPDDLPGIVGRYEDALHTAGVEASIGAASAVVTEPGTAMTSAFHTADEQMYAAKRANRARSA